MLKGLLYMFGMLLLSCSDIDQPRYPGISLSFDDRSIDEWFELRELFKEGKVTATFFITQPDSLSKSDWGKLKLLEEDGHEIGFHGSMHVLSEHYIQENSYDEYLDNEIYSGLALMDSMGFSCTSFAYPYGAKYWFTDFLLLRKFEHTRGVSPLNKERDLRLIDDIYYSFDGDRTLSAIGIDNNSSISETMIDKAIERAVNNSEVLMLYAHSPTKNKEEKEEIDYVVNIALLSYIIQKAKETHLKFYTMKALKIE